MAVITNELVKKYKRRGKSFSAVDKVSLSVPKGRITAVMGRSGSGKSTLLNILSGMIKPDEGQVEIDGINIFDVSERKRDELRSSKVSIIPQSQSLIGGLTTYDNLRLQASFSNQKHKENISSFTEVIDTLGLKELLNLYPSNLSGGEMKRVAIARAVLADSEYIFADEPTGELDKDNTRLVMELFKREADKGKGVLIITHDDLAAKMSDQIYTMENGRVMA